MKVTEQNAINRQIKDKRKIVQIAISNAMSEYAKVETIIALCNDGTLWQRRIEIDVTEICYGEWLRIQSIPQD
jgi:hypothetical protein